MTEFNRRDALLAAITACGTATEALLSRFRDAGDATLERSFKTDGSLVTNADLAADEAIAEALAKFDVTDRVESEESTAGSEGAALRWVVDPLCGTAPYAAGLGHWGVNVALMNRADPLLGAISIPTMRETLTSLTGRGVSRNGEPWEGGPPVGQLSEQIVDLEIDPGAMSTGILVDGSLSWVRGVDHTVTYSSMAYPFSQLCLGRLAGIVAYGVGMVHVAAGVAIANELGIVVSDGKGDAIEWSAEPPPVTVAAWPAAHDGLMELMRQ